MQTIKNLWTDSSGMVMTAEAVILATVGVLGVIVGLSNVQTGLIHELSDVGSAIDGLSQSYSFQGFRSATPVKIKSWVRGSRFVDRDDGLAGSLIYDCSATVVPSPAPSVATAPAPAPVVTPPAVQTPDPCVVPGTTTPAPATEICPPETTTMEAPRYYVPPVVGSGDCDCGPSFGAGPGLNGPVITEPIPVY